MKKYFDMKDFQEDLAKRNIAICHRFRTELSEEKIIDEADEILMEHIHEEYMIDYSIEKVCEALKISPEVILGAQGVTDMISRCECVHDKEDGRLSRAELDIRVGEYAKITMFGYDNNVRVHTKDKVMVLEDAKKNVFASSESLNDFIDMIVVMDKNTQKLLELNAYGKTGSKEYKKLMEGQEKLKQDFSEFKFKLDPKTAKSAAKDIEEAYSTGLATALDLTLVDNKVIEDHGKIAGKKLFSFVNRQMREQIEENVYNREVSDILD